MTPTVQALNQPVPPEPICDRCGHLLKEHVEPLVNYGTDHRNCARCSCTRAANEVPEPPTEYDRLMKQKAAIVARQAFSFRRTVIAELLATLPRYTEEDVARRPSQDEYVSVDALTDLLIEASR